MVEFIHIVYLKVQCSKELGKVSIGIGRTTTEPERSRHEI